MLDGLAIAIVVTKGWAISMAKTRPFTCWGIAWPFARLAIANFYVYSLLTLACFESVNFWGDR